jgi:predicted Fe-S protein YdhL (DUF1289 family)
MPLAGSPISNRGRYSNCIEAVAKNARLASIPAASRAVESSFERIVRGCRRTLDSEANWTSLVTRARAGLSRQINSRVPFLRESKRLLKIQISTRHGEFLTFRKLRCNWRFRREESIRGFAGKELAIRRTLIRSSVQFRRGY